MTRSSNKELIKPYNEPERVLHSLRKLFKTTSFDHSSSSEFELFSEYKEQVEGEIAETMTEPTREDGSKNEDANKHIKSILDIVDLFTTLDVTMDQLMLRVFPITLTGAASRCSTKQSWQDYPLKEEGKILEEAYYTQFGVPFSNLRRYRAAASGFYQRDNGNPSYQERIQTMEESLSKFMIQIGQMSKVLQERGSESLLSSTKTNLRDHVKSITTTEEADTTLIRRIGPNQYAVSSLKEDDNMPLIELSRTSVPFPSRLKEKIYDEKEILTKLKKLQVNSTKPAKTLRRLLKEKSRIKEEIKATMHEHFSTTLKDNQPQKGKY
ncbi:hypothetical protein Tco_1058814 [Tanacetum coccineum]|uniref:Uncharacterized protein n=1 Tax=Tanacetum coccineum TaxID=301880 RepID=A0ABQ5HB62_9ASTR